MNKPLSNLTFSLTDRNRFLLKLSLLNFCIAVSGDKWAEALSCDLFSTLQYSKSNMAYHVYLTISAEDRVARYGMDEATGALTHQADFKIEGYPASIAVNPDQTLLCVARRETLCLTSYRRDPVSGDLTEISSVPTPADACYQAIDKTGRFLFSVFYLGARVMVHRISPDGVLDPEPATNLETAIGAHCMQTDASNRFTFVPHVANVERGGVNTIMQFKFDAETGTLTPNDPFEEKPDPGVGPRHYVFHPTLDVVYFSNEQGSSVSTYAFDRDEGTLTFMDLQSTLPADFNEFSKCAQLRLTPDARYLYVANRGHDSLAGFRTDPETGRLTPLGQTPSHDFPRVMDIDPNGRFILSAGFHDGKMSVFRIGDDGSLENTATYDVGEEPMWISILPAG